MSALWPAFRPAAFRAILRAAVRAGRAFRRRRSGVGAGRTAGRAVFRIRTGARHISPERHGAGLGILLRRGDAEAFQHGGPVLGRAGDDRGEIDRDFEHGLARVLAALGEFPAEAFGEVGAHGAAAEAEVAVGGERRFRPGAVQPERARAFRGKGIFGRGFNRFQDCDHPLRSRFLRVRRIGGNAADADAGGLQGLALFGIEARRGLVRAQINRGAAFEDAEGEAPQQAFERFAGFGKSELRMRRKHAADLAAHPFLDPRQRRLALGGFGLHRADQFGARRHPLRALAEAGDGRVLVFDLGRFGQLEDFRRRRGDFGKPRGEHRTDGGERRAAHGLALEGACIDDRLEAQPAQAAHEMAFNGHVAFGRQVSHECIFFPQACEQGSGAPVHETGRQRKV